MSRRITEAELGSAEEGDVLQIFPDLGDPQLFLTRNREGRWETVAPGDQEEMWSISDEELIPHLLWWQGGPPVTEPEIYLFSRHEMSEGLEPTDSLVGEHPDDIAERLAHHRARLVYHQQRILFWEGKR